MRVVVVIVMPAFTQCEDGENEAVFARFARFVSAVAQKVAEGIDGKGRVVQDDGAQAKPPEEARPASDQVAGDPRDSWRDGVIFVQEYQFGKFGQILHPLGIIVAVVGRENPAQMRPVKALLLHGVDIVLLIGVLVMMAMMGRPP